MTHTFSLNFEKSIISASRVHGSRKRCNKYAHKCFEFDIKDLKSETKENVPIVPVRRRRVPWLFGPASSLVTKSIIYPCTKHRCSLPCGCFICQKTPLTCSDPGSEAGHSEKCRCHFDDHKLYHAAYHQGCKFCDQMVQAMPRLNFYYIFNSSEQFRTETGKDKDGKSYGESNGDKRDFEKSGFILHPGQKMKWDEWRQRFKRWLAAGCTDEAELWCPGCPTLFFSYDLLRKHMTTTHTVTKSFKHYYKEVVTAVPTDIMCNQCGSRFTKSCDLQRHVDSVHIKDYTRCEFCGMKFSRWDSYTRHKLRKHDSSVKNVCTTCGMKYDNAEALDKHVGVGPECKHSLKCEECAATFTRLSDLKRHKESTTKVTCNICGKEVCNGKVLKAHIKSEHEDSVSELKKRTQHSCEVCGQSFTLKKSLELHVKNRVSFSCQDCGSIFCNKRARNMHSYNIHGKQL